MARWFSEYLLPANEPKRCGRSLSFPRTNPKGCGRSPSLDRKSVVEGKRGEGGFHCWGGRPARVVNALVCVKVGRPHTLGFFGGKKG